jgi:hypothetical protein
VAWVPATETAPAALSVGLSARDRDFAWYYLG